MSRTNAWYKTEEIAPLCDDFKYDKSTGCSFENYNKDNLKRTTTRVNI